MFVLSRYNYFAPWRDGYHLAYNARSGAVALLTQENNRVLRELMVKIEERRAEGLSEEEQTLLKQLEHGQFVCAAEVPEIELLKFDCHQARYDVYSLGLVIAPTMACNMACVYCYEGTRGGRMSSATMDAVTQFVEKQAGTLKSLEVTWYGGEPLLAMDIIEELTSRLIRLTDKRGIKYKATIITNGYLLNRETVDRLRQLHIVGAQVTLDGPASIHNRKRPLVNGRPSFDTIIENLKYATTRLGVGIRVNVDKDYTRDTVGQLLQELDSAGLRERLSVYFSLMEPATAVCSNISENCYDTAGFSIVETDFCSLLLERGFRVDKLPSPMHVACMAQLVNAHVVDPDGNMYRCWNYIGDKSHSCGNIAQELNPKHPEFLRLFSVDPFEDSRCRACNVLPLCQGACPSRRLDRKVAADQQCESWRYNLEPMLDLIARSRWQQMQKANQEAKKAV